MRKLDEFMIKSLYESGFSSSQIARTLNSSSATIYRRLKQIGVGIRNHYNIGEKNGIWKGNNAMDSSARQRALRLYKLGKCQKGE